MTSSGVTCQSLTLNLTQPALSTGGVGSSAVGAVAWLALLWSLFEVL